MSDNTFVHLALAWSCGRARLDAISDWQLVDRLTSSEFNWPVVHCSPGSGSDGMTVVLGVANAEILYPSISAEGTFTHTCWWTALSSRNMHESIFGNAMDQNRLKFPIWIGVLSEPIHQRGPGNLVNLGLTLWFPYLHFTSYVSGLFGYLYPRGEVENCWRITKSLGKCVFRSLTNSCKIWLITLSNHRTGTIT